MSWQPYLVGDLNNPAYMHSDPDYLLALMQMQAGLTGLAAINPEFEPLLVLPMMLTRRDMTETLRRAVGTESRQIIVQAIEQAWDLVGRRAEMAGRFGLTLNERVYELYGAMRTMVQDGFNQVVDTGALPMLRLDGVTLVDMAKEIYEIQLLAAGPTDAAGLGAAAGEYDASATAIAESNPPVLAYSTTPIQIADFASISGRHIFYNNSYWDDPAQQRDDDDAIATDKEALLPGTPDSFVTVENYTSYSSGINGLMIDIADLPDGYTPVPDDFEFRAGNDDDPTGWSLVTAVPTVTLRSGVGDYNSDRVTITWDDGEIRNTWLEVTVKYDNLGLAYDDVFYFGNAVAEAGDSPADAEVNVTDLLLARNDPRSLLDGIDVTFPYDFDRDGQVDARDVLLARNNQTNFSSALNLIDLSGVAAEAQDAPLADMAWLSEVDQPAVSQSPAEKDAAADAVDKLLAMY